MFGWTTVNGRLGVLLLDWQPELGALLLDWQPELGTLLLD
jgi:hypothetical protein